MDFVELCRRKLELQILYRGTMMCNAPTAFEDMLKLEVERVATLRELNEIEDQIQKYIEGAE